MTNKKEPRQRVEMGGSHDRGRQGNTARSSGALFVFLCAVALCAPGCRKDDSGPEVIPLSGTIETIEMTGEHAGRISVLYYSEKHKQEMIGVGDVTKETEIMINGAVAKLSDLRKGDRIRGEVRVHKKGGTKTQTALRIYVDRPVPVGQDG